MDARPGGEGGLGRRGRAPRDTRSEPFRCDRGLCAPRAPEGTPLRGGARARFRPLPCQPRRHRIPERDRRRGARPVGVTGLGLPFSSLGTRARGERAHLGETLPPYSTFGGGSSGALSRPFTLRYAMTHQGGTVSSDPLIGAVLANRYRVVEPIGRGGAGAVYRGMQLQLDRKVAIKVVRHDVAEEVREELQARFYREASLAGRLSHPAIVQTIDYGTTEHGLQFVVMELLEGRTLKSALANGPMDPREAARLASELARGLHHAHSKGLIHRDVKSSNVLLITDEEGVEHPKLLDFGLVKSVRNELDVTQTPTYLGTPLYMSPEQATGSQELDGRSDQYSLGCLLYSMLTGKLPFVADSPMATALLHHTEPYPPMSKRAPDVKVDPKLEAIVERCMSKNVKDRFPDAGVLARALEDWRTPKVAATPVAAPTRARAGAAMLGALGAFGLVAVIGGVALLVVLAVVVGVLVVPIASRSSVSSAEPDHALLEDFLPEADDEDDDGADITPEAEEAEEGLADLEPSAEAAEEVPDAPPPAPAKPAPEPAPKVAPSPAPAKSAPEPAPKVAPSPAPAKPAPAPPAEPTPPAKSAPKSSSDGSRDEDDLLPVPIVVDDVTFTRVSHMRAVIAFVNRATREELIDAGVNERYGMVDAVLDNRPYTSVQQLGATPKIGHKTMLAIALHTEP
ncbi:MAG: serine/threonine protein kinase [Deltaproteobacteria bacterium]|nr:MAG: serine/threonine protein kinase [Deltaproteobacteria bacterium]